LCDVHGDLHYIIVLLVAKVKLQNLIGYKFMNAIFAKIIHMNLAVKFNLLKNTQPHYSYTPESCLENDNF
jgi:hypothetical protein